MKYTYTIYTPGGAVSVLAENHGIDQMHKLTLTNADYIIVSEFQVWHGYTRELLVHPSPEAAPSPHAPVEPGLPPTPGDFTAGPIVFEPLPHDDDIPF